jgi:hypothetical protein
MLVLSTRANSRVDVGNPSSIVRHPNKVTSLVEVGTFGTRLLPSWEYLFAHLSKYVSEPILNGIREEIRLNAPPEYTENLDEKISIGTPDEPSPPYIHPSECVDHDCLSTPWAEVKTTSEASTIAPEAERNSRLKKRKRTESNEISTQEFGVSAIKALPRNKNEQQRFMVWWSARKCTIEPEKNLTGINAELKREAILTGKKIKMVGARHEILTSSVPVFTADVANKRFYQDVGGYCGLNAVANALIQLNCPLSGEQYNTMRSFYVKSEGICSLQAVLEKLSKIGMQSSKFKGVRSQHLLQKMREQSEGVFVIIYDATHVLTWNAGDQTILDSDPRFPNPISINDETLKLLMPRLFIDMAYRIHIMNTNYKLRKLY